MVYCALKRANDLIYAMISNWHVLLLTCVRNLKTFSQHRKKHSRDIINILLTSGAFRSAKCSGNSGWGSQWNRHFPKCDSEILGIPCDVGLKFHKIEITRKFRMIGPFLHGPSFSEPGNRTQHGWSSSFSIQYQCSSCFLSYRRVKSLSSTHCSGSLTTKFK